MLFGYGLIYQMRSWVLLFAWFKIFVFTTARGEAKRIHLLRQIHVHGKKAAGRARFCRQGRFLSGVADVFCDTLPLILRGFYITV